MSMETKDYKIYNWIYNNLDKFSLDPCYDVHNEIYLIQFYFLDDNIRCKDLYFVIQRNVRSIKVMKNYQTEFKLNISIDDINKLMEKSIKVIYGLEEIQYNDEMDKIIDMIGIE